MINSLDLADDDRAFKCSSLCQAPGSRYIDNLLQKLSTAYGRDLQHISHVRTEAVKRAWDLRMIWLVDVTLQTQGRHVCAVVRYLPGQCNDWLVRRCLRRTGTTVRPGQMSCQLIGGGDTWICRTSDVLANIQLVGKSIADTLG